MPTNSFVAPRSATHRLDALVLKPSGDPIDEVLAPYTHTGQAIGTEKVRCECVWPACTGDLDEQIEVTMPLIVSQLDADNAAERWQELQGLWDLRWQRILAQPDCGSPNPYCRSCAGRGWVEQAFFGAFDYHDDRAEDPSAWTKVLRLHAEQPPTWVVPRKLSIRFAHFDIEAEGLAPEPLLPANPTTASSLLSLCEAGYVPAPAMVFAPQELHQRLDWENLNEWQIRVWELLLAHRDLEASVVRVARLGNLESQRPASRNAG